MTGAPNARYRRDDGRQMAAASDRSKGVRSPPPAKRSLNTPQKDSPVEAFDGADTAAGKQLAAAESNGQRRGHHELVATESEKA